MKLITCKYCGKDNLIFRFAGPTKEWVLYEPNGINTHKPLCDYKKGFIIRYNEYLKENSVGISCQDLVGWFEEKSEQFKKNHKFKSIRTLIGLYEKDLMVPYPKAEEIDLESI